MRKNSKKRVLEITIPSISTMALVPNYMETPSNEYSQMGALLKAV